MKKSITKFNKYCLAFIMGLMVTFGNELILCSDKGVLYSNNKSTDSLRCELCAQRLSKFRSATCQAC